MPKSTLGVLLEQLLGSLFVSLRYNFGCGPHKIHKVDSPPPEGLEFRQVTYDNVGLIREWKGPLYVRRFRALLNRGYVGIYGIMDGKVVSYSWAVAKLDARSPGCSHDLIEVGDAMRGRLETRPEYRRRGIGTHSRVQTDKLLRQLYGDRVKRSCGAGLVHNEPMHQLVQKLRGPQPRRTTPRHEMHLMVFLRYLYVYRLWDVEPSTRRRLGRGRLIVRLKVPDFLFSPAFKWLGFGPQPTPLLAANPAVASEPA
jgi:GNAT superfamily N-acetyltransferase